MKSFRACVPALVGLALGLRVDAPAAEDFARRFAQPPNQGRILKIIHGWPDMPEAQDDLIRRLTAQGFGGVVCNVSFDQYLESEAHWQAFERAVREARKAGMVLWLYDERGYPSGNAGGLVLRNHPDWEARGGGLVGVGRLRIRAVRPNMQPEADRPMDTPTSASRTDALMA